MASSKLMTSSKSHNSDHNLSSSTTSSRSRRASSATSLATSTTTNTPPQYHLEQPSFSDQPTMTVDNLIRDAYGTPSAESTLLDAQITVVEPPRTVDEVWREIVAGRKEMKVEEEMMTLEDFLVKAGAVEDTPEVKMETAYGFDNNNNDNNNNNNNNNSISNNDAFDVLDKMEGSIVAYGSNGMMDNLIGCGGGGRGKRGRAASLMEPLDKAAQQRQRRMIKNRESAARSRERKQAYQVELESMAVRLEEENERLLKEKEERTKERFKQLMEKVIPIVEKRRPPRVLRRVRSFEW